MDLHAPPTLTSPTLASPTLACPRLALAAGAQRCAVCDSTDLGIDEVFERGLWRLGECRRCHHRWTEGPQAPPPVAAARRVRSQSAAA